MFSTIALSGDLLFRFLHHAFDAHRRTALLPALVGRFHKGHYFQGFRGVDGRFAALEKLDDLDQQRGIAFRLAGVAAFLAAFDRGAIGWLSRAVIVGHEDALAAVFPAADDLVGGGLRDAFRSPAP